jgi:hypothetical protein
MRTALTAALTLALALLGCTWAQAALAADEAGPIYDPGQVFFVDLTISPTEKAKLEAEPGEYVKGTFEMTKSADGTPSGAKAPFISSRNAEIRLKGNVGGSFRNLSEKPGFKLKFKKTEAALGLRKMTLNNMVQDPSMVHETLAYAAFRAAGVPASRTGYAYVRLNGEDIGVYLDLENLDETGLARIFGSFDKTTQHLYEGEGGHDVKPGEATAFEVDEGSEENIADLEGLIEIVNSAPGVGEDWSEHVAAKADLAEMAKMWAVEKYIDHWDGYSGHAEPFLRPNNYYLYSEPSGRFQMLPWGADQTWIPTKGVPNREVTFEGDGGVLFNKCLEDEACIRQYWEALKSVTETIATLGPQALAENTATMLAPWQAEEIANGRPEYDATEIKEGSFGLDETIEFIEGRQAEAEQWLAANEPPSEGGGEEPGGEEPEGGSEEGKGGGEEPVKGISSRGEAGSLPPRAVPAPGSVTVDRLTTAPGAIDAHLSVSGPGAVTEWITMRTAAGRRNVCTVLDRPVAQAPTVRCDLSRAARRRLSGHAVGFEINVTFVPQDGGAAATTSRRFTARASSAARPGAIGRSSTGRKPSAPH